jgi:AAA family ATP:ADP antiporter
MLHSVPARLLRLVADVEPHEVRAVLVAFALNFVLLASYYILRPLRDTMATVFGVEQLQYLFFATFVATLLCSPVYSALAARLRLARFLPGVFWFWLANILLFYVLFELQPASRTVAAGYYIWFSVVNLFLISVFWSLMVDLFSPRQATRLFGVIAAGGSIGAIGGPLLTRTLVRAVGVGGLLLIAAAGFLLVIALIYALMREKERLQAAGDDTQASTLDHSLPGNPFDGFRRLLRSTYMINQAAFFLLMTWIATIAYFMQTDLVTKAFSDIASRTQVFADIDLAVNVCSALIATFGIGRFVQRFGVTAGLLANPVIMIVTFLGIALAPTLLMVQALQVIRRVGQYAIARPSREICFTVVEQESRYKVKNVIDTVIYRFGDVSAAWVQAGLRAAGLGLGAAVGLAVGASVVWGAVAIALGRRYEQLRAAINSPQ